VALAAGLAALATVPPVAGWLDWVAEHAPEAIVRGEDVTPPYSLPSCLYRCATEQRAQGRALLVAERGENLVADALLGPLGAVERRAARIG